MCDDCGDNARTGDNDGYRICLDCGMQLSPILDTGIEWRNGDGPWGSRQHRVGARLNPLLKQWSMRTYVRQRKSASAESRAMSYGIIRQHSWTAGATPYDERTRRQTFCLIEQSCDALGLNRAVQLRASCVFATASELLRTRSDGRKGLIAASVMRASKEAGVPRSLKELARVFSTTPANITKGSSQLNMALYLGKSSPPKALHISRASDYVARFCFELQMLEGIASVAAIVADRADKTTITCENEPPSVAGGAILLVFELFLSPERAPKSRKTDIAAAAGVSVVTIVKVRKRLHRYRADLFTSAESHVLRELRKNKAEH